MASAPLPAKLTIITTSPSSNASYSTALIPPYCPIPNSCFINLSRAPHIPIDLSSIGLSASPPVIPAPEPSGSVMVFTDYAPYSASPFHQTPSVDYAVVVYGRIILEVEGGGVLEFGPGEAIVQAGARHRRRNGTREWTRVLFVMVGAFGNEVKEEGG